jgi:hypothetical protein
MAPSAETPRQIAQDGQHGLLHPDRGHGNGIHTCLYRELGVRYASCLLFCVDIEGRDRASISVDLADAAQAVNATAFTPRSRGEVNPH